MEFKQCTEDLLYLFSEMNTVLTKFKSDIPEDIHKILKDLVYHSTNSVKELEVLYGRLNETRDDSVC